MGNHEYCEDCGENDFHHGRPCDPEKRAKVLAAERKRESDRRDKLVVAEKVLDLVGNELDASLEWSFDNSHNGNLVIRNPAALLAMLTRKP